MVSRFNHVPNFPFAVPANQPGAVNHNAPRSVISIPMIATGGGHPGGPQGPPPPQAMQQAVAVANLANQMQSQNQMKQMSHPTDYHAAMQQHHNLAAQVAQGNPQLQQQQNNHSHAHPGAVQSPHSQVQPQNQQPKVIPNLNNTMNPVNLTSNASHPASYRAMPPRNDNYIPTQQQAQLGYATVVQASGGHHGGPSRVMSSQSDQNKSMQQMFFPRQHNASGTYRPQTSQQNRPQARPQPTAQQAQPQVQVYPGFPYSGIYQPNFVYQYPMVRTFSQQYFQAPPGTYLQPRVNGPTNSGVSQVATVGTPPIMMNNQSPVPTQVQPVPKQKPRAHALEIKDPNTGEVMKFNADANADNMETASTTSTVTDCEYETGSQEALHQQQQQQQSAYPGGAILPGMAIAGNPDIQQLLQANDTPVVSANIDGPDITPKQNFNKNKKKHEKAIEIKPPPPEMPKQQAPPVTATTVTSATAVAIENEIKEETSSHEESKANLAHNLSDHTDLESTISSANTGSPKSDAHNVKEGNISDSGVSLDNVKMSPPPPQPQPVPVIESSLSYDAKSFEPKKQREQRVEACNNVMDSHNQDTSEENGNMLNENSILPPSKDETDKSIISTTTTVTENIDDNTIITTLDNRKLDSNNGNLLAETNEIRIKETNDGSGVTTITATTTTTTTTTTQEIVEEIVNQDDVMNANNTPSTVVAPAKLTAFQTAPGSLHMLESAENVSAAATVPATAAAPAAVRHVKSAASRSLEKPPSTGIQYEPDQWSPVNTQGKKKYSVTQLLEISKLENAKVKPEIDPSLESILKSYKQQQFRNDRHGGFQIASGLMPNFARTSGGGRGGQLNKVPSQQGRRQDQVGNRSGSRSGEMKKITLSLKGEVKLKEVENAWRPKMLQGDDTRPQEEKETEELLRVFRSTLNKLTPDNFNQLLNEIINAKIDTKERLEACIKLVFEKAIAEPNYSVVYAQTCKRLGLIKIPAPVQETKDSKNVTFKVILLNQCQHEFEKHREDKTDTSDKIKAMENEQDEKKRAELKEQFDEEQMKIRRRAVGTVRFIGELYKIDMLNHRIMNNCISLLLIENGDEDSLECLCKLLTTVGKKMEEKDKCLDEYFKKLEAIANNKQPNLKVSSRIRFAIKDVIDLRKNKWAPRRQDANPKTMNQIQKEKETEERNIELLNYQTPHKRDDRRGGSMTGGKYGNKKQDGDWVTPNPKNTRAQQQTFDFSKVNTTVSSQSDVVLGPGTNFTQFFNNRFAGLSDDASAASTHPEDNYSNNNKKYDNYNNRGNLQRQGSRENSRQRNDMNGPSRSFQSSVQRQSSTGPGGASAVGGTQSQIISRRSQQSEAGPVFSEKDEPKEDDRKRMKALLETLINEFIANKSIDEFISDFKSSIQRKHRWVALREMFLLALDKHDEERFAVEKLCFQCLERKDNTLLTTPEYKLAVKQFLGLVVDIAADYPKLFQYLALYLAQELHAGLISFKDIHDYSSDIIEFGYGEKMLVNLFENLLNRYGPGRVRELWLDSGFKYGQFLGKNVTDDEVNEFVAKHKLEYIIDSSSVAQVSSKLTDQHAIQKKLQELIASTKKIDCNMINQWVETHVADSTDKGFIRALFTSTIEYAIMPDRKSVDEKKMEDINTLLLKYIDNNEKREIEALYAVQTICRNLSWPSGLLYAICDTLSCNYIISNDAFTAWKLQKQATPEDLEGHGISMMSLTQFFTQMQEADTDEFEDDATESNNA